MMMMLASRKKRRTRREKKSQQRPDANEKSQQSVFLLSLLSLSIRPTTSLDKREKKSVSIIPPLFFYLSRLFS